MNRSIFVVESGLPNEQAPGCSCVREESRFLTRCAAEVAAAQFRANHPDLDAWVVEIHPVEVDPRAW